MLAAFLWGNEFFYSVRKKITPILSLFCMAEKASVAAISVTMSR